jgi:hypothetical protein
MLKIFVDNNNKSVTVNEQTCNEQTCTFYEAGLYSMQEMFCIDLNDENEIVEYLEERYNNDCVVIFE